MKNTQDHWEDRYKDDKDVDRWKSDWRMGFYKWAAESIKEDKCKVADFGSGFGYGLAMLQSENPYWKVTGIDFSKHACLKAVVPTECIDILNETINEKFDYTLCVQTLEHFKNPESIVDKLLEITNKQLIITVPYKEDISNHTEHEYSFDRAFFQRFNKPVLTNVQHEFKRIKAIIFKSRKDYKLSYYLREWLNIKKEKNVS